MNFTGSAIPLPEIPVKLRCTICSELARGASRLPCCEQSICESCRSKLPDVCPVCDHSPLSADDCKPNGALRTTVAVFLRTAEKKHNLSMQKLQKEQAKSVEPPTEAKVPEPEPEKHRPSRTSPVVNPLTPPQETEELARSEGSQVPQVSPPAVRENAEQPVEKSPRKKEATPVPDQQANGFVGDQNAWFGQNTAQMGGMPNMFSAHGVAGSPWGDYSMIQNMQGGWANGYGGMMGYAMGMNPMAMAQGGGFNGGGYGGMGMNGTGFNNGQDGGSMGWNNGWNGQNNVGFNPGIDGTRNGGFYSAASAGGYNHQSHGHHQMPQQYHNPHFQRQQPYQRGGRGGGFAGAGQRQVSLERQQQNFQDAQFQQQIQGIDEAVAAVTTSGEKKGEKIQTVVSEDPDNIADATDVPTDSTSAVVAGGAIGTTEDLAESYNSITPVNPDMAAQYFPTDDFRSQGFQQQQVYPMQFNNGFRGGFRRGGFRGDFAGGHRGGGHAGPIPTVPGSTDGDRRPVEGLGLGVEGAPTGPKALRERGLSRSGPPIRAGFMGRRGGHPASSWTRSISPDHAFSRSKSQDSRRRSRSPDRERSRDRDRSRDRSRDRRRSIRSRSRHRKRRSLSVEVNGERPRGRSIDRDTAEPPSATTNPPESANDVTTTSTTLITTTTTTTTEAQEAGDKEAINTPTINGTQEPASGRNPPTVIISALADTADEHLAPTATATVIVIGIETGIGTGIGTETRTEIEAEITDINATSIRAAANVTATPPALDPPPPASPRNPVLHLQPQLQQHQQQLKTPYTSTWT
ncbi:hypothetical protein L873DRAFT_489489 [Choiromyces venosus 120613-1]|uniref:RING-type domain-containing protein n=1 Tax=Choiromyces venosus 120613-1 TaxID=1336337 RepID=A0A3N4K160_9PEZI|nr:hypothetical protein L873DRAFT_489489 [Choiromyces venosus 120613-1]